MRIHVRLLLVLTLLLLVAACGGGDEEEQPSGEAPAGDAEQPAAVVDEATAATITGQVNFEGTPPEPELIRMDAEPTCQEMYDEGPYTQTVVVNDNGTLQNVFVYVKEGLEDLEFPTPEEPVILDQEGCRYHPHVLGMQVNQPLLIRNSDAVLHNIKAQPSNSRGFNFGQPREDMESERTITEPEVMVSVECDVHGWMNAYIGVLEHPYFSVTGADGSFELAPLPPGEYVIEAWHEEYGTQTMTVTVGEQETSDIEFTFQGG